MRCGRHGTPLEAALCGGKRAGIVARRLLAAGAAPQVDSRLEARFQLVKEGADDLGSFWELYGIDFSKP